MRVGALYSAKNYPYSHALDDDPSKTYVLVNPNKQVNPNQQVNLNKQVNPNKQSRMGLEVRYYLKYL